MNDPVSIYEAASMIDMKVKDIWGWIEDGLLTPVIVGKEPRIQTSDLMETIYKLDQKYSNQPKSKEPKKEPIAQPATLPTVPIPTQLYRHYDNLNTLLYVGISISAIARLSQHKECSEWFFKISSVTIEQHPSRESALNAERKAIQTERPIYNIAHQNVLPDESTTATPLPLPPLLLEPPKPKLVYKEKYSFGDAMRMLGVSGPKLWDLIRSGQVQKVKGGVHDITGASIKAFIEYRDAFVSGKVNAWINQARFL